MEERNLYLKVVYLVSMKIKKRFYTGKRTFNFSPLSCFTVEKSHINKKKPTKKKLTTIFFIPGEICHLFKFLN